MVVKAVIFIYEGRKIEHFSANPTQLGHILLLLFAQFHPRVYFLLSKTILASLNIKVLIIDRFLIRINLDYIIIALNARFDEIVLQQY